MVKLAFWVQDGGDGSANVRFCASEKEAKAAEEADAAEYGGWGEPSCGHVELRVVDGHIEFQRYNNDLNKYEWVQLG